MARSLRAALCVAIILGVPQLLDAQQSSKNKTSPYVQVTLRQQLQKGLKCRRPVEFQFVNRVADLVDDGKLPIKYVNICYDWSLQKNSFRPYVYFERSLTLLAKEKGFKL